VKFLGPNACEEALDRNGLQTLRVAPAAWGRLAALRERAAAAGVSVQREPAEALDRRAGGGRHQGVVGEGADLRFTEMPELLGKLRDRGNDGLVLLLDGITDPHNFGAILRSAAAANVDGVVFPERRSAKVNETVIRASAGTAGRVPLVRVVNLGRTIDELKGAGVWVFGMSASAPGDYLDERFDRASAIVLGSEGEGLHLKIEERCDSMLRIGMPGNTDSLNVSATAAIVLFRAVARREKKC
jgi:23S rRNA (guanosine2251-2'-O)-methyltransferase